MLQPLFQLGRIVATPGALELLSDNAAGDDAAGGDTVLTLLQRHVSGDWGDLDDEDKGQNDIAVKESYRILSAYHLPNGTIWVITEHDRSVTTLLKPDEY